MTPLDVYTCSKTYIINSLRPSGTYMCLKTKPSLVQIMAWRLFGAKPLSEPMMIYCQLNPKEDNSVKKCCLQKISAKCRPFCLRLNELSRPR